MSRAVTAVGSDAGVALEPRVVIVLAALAGGTLACLLGRERTRIDNFLAGGLVAGLGAFRDPREDPRWTIAIAAAEGVSWGIGDRVLPVVREAIMPGKDHR